MSSISFFTPVSYVDRPKSLSQFLLEYSDSYFFLFGKKACVIPGHLDQSGNGVILFKDSTSYFILTALKVASYFTVAIPILMLMTKAILRSTHSFHLVDAKKMLEEEVEISQDTIEKIQKLMPKIIKLSHEINKDDDEIRLYNSSNNIVFSLRSVPNLVFKTSLFQTDKIESRFAKMVKAKEACLVHQLESLIVPHAKRFDLEREGQKMSFIAEEFIDFQHETSEQERLYQQLPDLNEPVRQLATFIATIGFTDVEWRNIPIVDSNPEYQGLRHVALVDLEEMDESRGEVGIYGDVWPKRRGLVSCLGSEEQIDIAIDTAYRHGVSSRHKYVKSLRLEEIASYKKLQQYYIQNGIDKMPKKTIQVDDLNSLGLDLEEQGYITTRRYEKNGTDGTDVLYFESIPTTLREATNYVIAYINEAIIKAPDSASTKGKRYVFLNTNQGRLQDYGREKIGKQSWLRNILDSLVNKGHIFKIDDINGNGFFIQA